MGDSIEAPELEHIINQTFWDAQAQFTVVTLCIFSINLCPPFLAYHSVSFTHLNPVSLIPSLIAGH